MKLSIAAAGGFVGAVLGTVIGALVVRGSVNALWVGGVIGSFGGTYFGSLWEPS
jgi:hypothetical protein